MRKGLELPINVLVVVALAVIVLLGIIALYMLGTGGPISSISLASAKQSGCSQLMRSSSCGVAPSTIQVGFDVANTTAVTPDCGKAFCPDGQVNSADTLDKLLIAYYSASATDVNGQKKICGCPGY